MVPEPCGKGLRATAAKAGAEDPVDGRGEIGERERRERLRSPGSGHLAVAPTCGVPENLDRLSQEVDAPDLRNPGPGIERRLDSSIEVERRVCNLDDQLDVSGSREVRRVVPRVEDSLDSTKTL